VAHAFNPNPGESETKGWQVQGQPELHSETLSLKKKRRKENSDCMLPLAFSSVAHIQHMDLGVWSRRFPFVL
jgi:hypothetical protein